MRSDGLNFYIQPPKFKPHSWEQRKFADVVQIERGGSPRPIDDYITDSPNGLNWVKIGDAPAQGHYITKTAEKIRPQGLSKTREVHPGDLILSNSNYRRCLLLLRLYSSSKILLSKIIFLDDISVLAYCKTE